MWELSPDGSIATARGDHCWSRGSKGRAPVDDRLTDADLDEPTRGKRRRLRKPLDRGEARRTDDAFRRRPSAGSALTRAAGVRRPAVSWRMEEGPRYEKQIAMLEIDRAQVRLRVKTTANADWRAPSLRPTIERRLA